MRKRRWIWIVFLLFLVAVLATLATRFNLVILENYNRARVEPILGTLGFAFTLIGLIIFFLRLWQEMRLNQIQSEFLAAVTHELKTPISTLELSASLLRQTDLSEHERETLWKSHDSELNRLKNEVETLLEAARWDTKSVRANQEKIDLEEWIQLNIPLWTQILGPNGNLSRKGDRLNGRIKTDRKIFNLIATNIIENARKFSKNKNPSVEILTHQLSQTEWSIQFKDEGIGFDPKDVKNIFKRFYRSKTSFEHSIPGTGLGLYLVKEASKRMQIKVSASSLGPQQGTTIELSGKFKK